MSPVTYSPKQSLEVQAVSGDGHEALIPLLDRTNADSPDGFATDEAASSRQQSQQKGRTNREARLYAAAGLTLVVLMACALVRAVTPARPRFPAAKTSVPALDQLLGALLHSTTPATLANDYLRHRESVNVGVVPFSDRAFSPSYSPAPLEHSLTTEGWSASCLEAFVASGDLCDELVGRYRESKVATDIVWTWVNGSSAELLSHSMVQASGGGGSRKRSRAIEAARSMRRRAGATVFRHFRDHDELRFSIRSVLASLSDESLSTLHLVVGDTPAILPEPPLANSTTRPPENASSDYSSSLHYAQIPHWVELASLQLAPPNHTSVAKAGAAPYLRIHPHSTLFRTPPESAGPDVSGNESARWRNAVVPSFNSLAIESQFPNIDFTAKTALYLNDDFFLTRELAITDVASPIYGPVLRLQRDLLVSGVAPENTHDSPDGEWKGLGYSAWLLDERFGARSRPYLLHIAKVIPVPIMKEAQEVFIRELTSTASSRFRGDELTEVQTMFLVTHYVVEKHREALLWSFFLARSDVDGSGTYSLSERRDILTALGHTPGKSTLNVPPHKRTTLANMAAHSGDAGLPAPLQTFPQFSSADGYAYTNIHTPPGRARGSGPIWPLLAVQQGRTEPICTLDFDQCFGSDFLSLGDEAEVSAVDVYRRVAFAKPECGDCVIALLVGKSGPRGLEAFLPPSTDAQNAVRTELVQPIAIGLETTKWRDLVVDLPATDLNARRQQATALIQRYAYTLGDTPSFFYPVRAGGDALTHRLEEITDPGRADRPALVALNDDVGSVRPGTLDDIDLRLERWFQQTWPVPSPWESN
ncbi:hypothetical protein JCM3774_004122 [Rhodotorula dairenensis]